MANTLVQFRVEESTREKAVKICERVGIDIPTYMRMCLSRLVQDNGVPFPMKLEKTEDNKGIRAMQEASRIAANYGIAEMSLEDINQEISEARLEDINLSAGRPLAYGELTKEQFNAEIEKGMADIENGRVYSADEIEAEMKRDFGV